MPVPDALSRSEAQRLRRGAAGSLAAAALALGAGVGLAAHAGVAGPAGIAGGLAVFAAVAATVLATVATHHRFPRFGAANAVTTARCALGCILIALLSGPGPASPPLAWGFALAAGLCLALDGVDGWLARRQGLASAFGARYDMEIDSILILTLAAAAWTMDKAGPWVLASGLIRYVFVAAGWLWPSLAAPLPPSFRRKLVCVIQTAALALLLIPPVRPPWSVAVAAVALAVLVWSFAVDLAWLARQPRRPAIATA